MWCSRSELIFIYVFILWCDCDFEVQWLYPHGRMQLFQTHQINASRDCYLAQASVKTVISRDSLKTCTKLPYRMLIGLNHLWSANSVKSPGKMEVCDLTKNWIKKNESASWFPDDGTVIFTWHYSRNIIRHQSSANLWILIWDYTAETADGSSWHFTHFPSVKG